MNIRIDPTRHASALDLHAPINVSRRHFLIGIAVGALVIAFGLPISATRVQAAVAATTVERGTQVPALLKIRMGNRVRLLCAFK